MLRRGGHEQSSRSGADFQDTLSWLEADSFESLLCSCDPGVERRLQGPTDDRWTG